MNTADELYDRITALDKDLSSVIKDQDVHGRAMLKLELTIDKLQTLAEAMHRLISIHDERINNNSKIVDSHILQSDSQRDQMSQDIKDLNSRLTQDTATLSTKIDSMEDSIGKKIDGLTKRMDDKEEKDLEIQKHDRASFSRLKKIVDKWHWILMGIVFVIGLIGGEHNIMASILKFFVAG